MNLIAVSKGLNGAHYILVNTDGTFVIWVLQAAAETKSEPSIARRLATAVGVLSLRSFSHRSLEWLDVRGP